MTCVLCSQLPDCRDLTILGCITLLRDEIRAEKKLQKLVKLGQICIMYTFVNGHCDMQRLYVLKVSKNISAKLYLGRSI